MCSIDNCEECNSTGLCRNCSSGYELVDGICVQGCPAACAEGQCNEFTGKCFGCDSGFTLDAVANMCYNCSVANCSVCSADNVCA